MFKFLIWKFIKNKTLAQHFFVNFVKFIKTAFLQNRAITTSDYSNINSSEGELANETVSYDTEIKAEQFVSEGTGIKNVLPGDRTSLIVFSQKKSVIQFAATVSIQCQLEKITCCCKIQHLSDKFTAGRKFLNYLYLYKAFGILLVFS